MSHTIESLQVPLRKDAEGSIRVGGTRVTLDTIVAQFNAGQTAEQIAENFDTLTLEDIYATIAYYLRHREELEEYLREGEEKAEALRQATLKRFPPGQIRARLLARRERSEA
ncbi:DUF433 domain-containing protein [Planctomycetota bacterium]